MRPSGHVAQWAGAALVALFALQPAARAQRVSLMHDPTADPAVGFNLTAFRPDRSHPSDWSGAVRRIAELGFTAVNICAVRFFDRHSGTFEAVDRAHELRVLAAALSTARALGLTSTVVPFAEPAGYDGWRGAYDPEAEGVASAWWAGYTAYVAEISAIADAYRADRLVVGTEIDAALRSDRDGSRARALITAARDRFPGELGYSANWNAIGEAALFDRLDFVGIDAYPPLADAAAADASGAYPDTRFIAGLTDRWVRFLDETVLPFARSRKEGRGMPVILMEHGLVPFNRTTVQPFSTEAVGRQPLDIDEQVNGLHALFAAVAGRKAEIPAVMLWHWSLAPGGDDSPYALRPDAIETGQDGRWTMPWGHRAGRWLVDFVDRRRDPVDEAARALTHPH
jgi:hypothetical protein